MTDRFDIKCQLDETWAVIHGQSGIPVTIHGVPQTGLNIFEAGELCDVLNAMDSRKTERAVAAPSSHMAATPSTRHGTALI